MAHQKVFGLNAWTREFLKGAKEDEERDEDGRCHVTYFFPNREVFTVGIQGEPWPNGPLLFMVLHDERGVPVKESLWSEDEVTDQVCR